MIPAWLSRLGARLLPGILAAGAFFALIAEAFRRGRKQSDLEHDAEDAEVRLETERRMAAVPPVGTDADLVRRLREGGL